ncbi:MAG: zf-HC2 domain-containing protein [Candidatus Zixiibacteriota bacterium]
MEKDYSKYSEKLSAYLDGELSAREMAEIADALEKDSNLATELERLARLRDMAEQSLPEFEEEILDSLENRIMSNLENKSLKGPLQESQSAKIFPVWRKYLTAAAAIAVVFLAGRIAYQEYGTDILSPAENRKIFSPKVKSPFDADSLAVEEHILQDSITEDEISIPLEDSRITERQDKTVLEESAGKTSMKAEKVTIPAPVKTEIQIDGQDYVVDRKEAEEIMPPETDIKVELTQIKPQLNSSGIRSFAVAPPRGEKGTEDQIFAADDSENGFTIASIDSLDKIFDNYAPIKTRSKKSAGEVRTFGDAISKVSLNEPVLQLMDSLRTLPEYDQASKNIENQYLKILATKHLYQITGEKQYYDEAVENLNSLKALIDSQLIMYPDNQNLIDYKDRINNLDISD